MSPILNPTIQLLIVLMYTPNFKIVASTVPEKTVTQILTCKIGKERKREKMNNKSNELKSQSHDTITYFPYVFHI